MENGMLIAILIGIIVPSVFLFVATRSPKPLYDECDLHGGPPRW